MERLIVFFMDGDERHFPKVIRTEVCENNLLKVYFGHDHIAMINVNNVKFMESFTEQQ